MIRFPRKRVPLESRWKLPKVNSLPGESPECRAEPDSTIISLKVPNCLLVGILKSRSRWPPFGGIGTLFRNQRGRARTEHSSNLIRTKHNSPTQIVHQLCISIGAIPCDEESLSATI